MLSLQTLFFRHIWLPAYGWWVMRYVRKTRQTRFCGLLLHIPPGVFHPNLFFSTPIFATFLQRIDLQGKKLLDVGCGSGALSLVAAQKGAEVTGVDLNPLAVKTARLNARLNALPADFWESDLLIQIPVNQYDIVLVNPPYYPRDPQHISEYAFFAGENFMYFERFFAQIKKSIRPQHKIWMILSENCDLERIGAIALKNGFRMAVVFEQKKWTERFYIFECISL
jgi:release factor glutamine methyltransferase